MRTIILCAIGAAALAADPVPEGKAKEALAAFAAAFRAPDVEAKQNAIFDLRDVPNDLVLKELEKLIKHRDARIRNVAAMAMGGQIQSAERAGDVLMRSFRKRDEAEEVVASAIDSMRDLEYRGYWPDAKFALKDDRTVVVVATLALLGDNKDWRAFPDLVDLYREIMPRRITWHTGAVVLPDGTDEEAKAQWESKYGVGGAKEKAKAKAKAAAFDRRNFSPQIRACVKKITGQQFDNAFDLEEWWCENYVMVARKTAEYEGKDPESAVPRARIEQAELRAKVAEERRKMTEEAARAE